MFKIKTKKGVTYVHHKDELEDMIFDEGGIGISNACQFIFQTKLIEYVLGNREKVITRLPATAFPATSLIPNTPKKKTIFTESEEEHISDRVIHITA